MDVGRMIFFDKITGAKIIDTGQWMNVKAKKTIEQQIETYPTLSERNRETFDVLELEYGAYTQEFTEASSYRVNPETKKLEFAYDTAPGDEPVYEFIPFSEQIETMKGRAESLERENSFILLEMLKAQEQAEAVEEANASLTLELIIKGVL